MAVAETEQHETQGASLAMHLLCAVPQLLDENFHRAVILLIEHGPSGALGLSLQHSTGTTIAEVARALEMQWDGDPSECVRLGGPVERVRGWILHDQADWDVTAEELTPGLHLTTSLDVVRKLGNECFGGEGGHYLFLLGYAGWGPGQLEEEIAAGSWILVPIHGATCSEQDAGVRPEWLFEAAPDAIWTEALQTLGIDPARLIGLRGGAVH